MTDIIDPPDEGGMDDGNDEAGTSSKAVRAVQAALTWAYDAALDGIPGFGTLDELVASYLRDGTKVDDAIESLIAWQIGKAGTAGFITGLGGLLTLPAAIPANLASVLFIQLRLIAGIAKMRGYDVHSDQVKSLCVACLAGSAVTDVLKDVGIKLGTQLGKQAIKQIAGTTLVRINQAVGFRLVTKAGSTGLVNLTKMVPFIGGIVGGTFDAVMTATIAQAAKSVFTPIDTDGTGENKVAAAGV